MISIVEELNNVNYARAVYRPFLEKFPYCYGYWRKFADFETRHNNFDRAVEVYEQGVTKTPLSVDLWLSYFDFLKEMSSITSKKMDLVKKLRQWVFVIIFMVNKNKVDDFLVYI